MGKLITTKPIYYKGKNYVPGEEIHGTSAEIIEAWKRAGSVKELVEQEKENVEGGSDGIKEEIEEEAAKEPVKKGKRGK